MKQLPDKALPNGGVEIAFENLWREGFVGEALTLELCPNNCILAMEFYSADFGVVQWCTASGFSVPRGWDDPSALDKISTARFECRLLNGAISPEVTPKIIDGVLRRLRPSPLKTAIEQALGA